MIFISLKLKDWSLVEDIEEEKEDTISDIISNTSLDEVKFILEEKTIDNINNMINKLISDAADTYRILVVDSDNEDLTTKKADEMTNYIKYKVSHNMTPTILASISMLYDISSPDKISELLDEKIKIYMIGLIVNRNKLS